MKRLVLIYGTNGVGKTTLAKEIIKRCGGIEKFEADITYLRNGKVSLAGKYSVKYGGLDWLNSTKILPTLAMEAFKRSDTLIIEGKMSGSFDGNIGVTSYAADSVLCIPLFCNLKTLDERIKQRGGGGVTEHIVKDQKKALNISKKWKEAGAVIMPFDTSTMNAETIADDVLKKIL